MSRQAHPAFPPLNSQPSIVPSTSPAVFDLLNHCTSPEQIHQVLLRTLAKIANGENQPGKTKDDQIRSGEELLAMHDWDLNALSDGDMRSASGTLIYVLSARMRSKRGSRGPRSSENLLNFALHLANIAEQSQLVTCSQRVGTFSWALLRLAQSLRATHQIKATLFQLGNRTTARNQFSSIFAAYLEACLIDRDYTQALQVIHEVHLSVKSSHPSYLDIITYYHHAGLICAATRDYTKAVEMFTIVVSVPTSYASAIQLAAAKRAILCELLVSGTAVRFPKYTSSAVSRAIEKGAADYTKLAKAFEARDWFAIKGLDIAAFKTDCNMGLVHAVQLSATKRQILKIKDAYSRLPIEALAAKVGRSGSAGSAEVLDIVNDMIRSNSIRATISQTTPDSTIVSFLEGDLHDSTPRAIAQINALSRMTTLLEGHLQESTKRMGLDPDYLRKLANTIEITGGKSGRGGGGMTEFESMMAAQEAAVGVELGGFGRTGGGKVGADHTDMGY